MPDFWCRALVAMVFLEALMPWFPVGTQQTSALLSCLGQVFILHPAYCLSIVSHIGMENIHKKAQGFKTSFPPVCGKKGLHHMSKQCLCHTNSKTCTNGVAPLDGDTSNNLDVMLRRNVVHRLLSTRKIFPLDGLRSDARVPQATQRVARSVRMKENFLELTDSLQREMRA